MNIFCNKSREKQLQEASSKHYDLIIIGGGITGAGIALDASSRGLTTLLVEKEDYAWGTSSRSTKLIHGGLRYLKQLEIRLVREVGTERGILYKNALPLVRPERMLLPIYKDGSLGKLSSSIGLYVYDFLAKVDKDERRRMLSREETISTEPLLQDEELDGGGLYYEYRTDDARLTIHTLRTAVDKYDCAAFNHLECTAFLYDAADSINGIRCKDHCSGAEFSFSATGVINASGPWVDKVSDLDSSTPHDQKLALSRGVHIVVPHHKLPIKQSVYFDVPHENRMIFAIPRQEITYVGTTDTFHCESIDRPAIHTIEASYLINAVNHAFKDINLTIADIISSWSGLRPLIYTPDKESKDLSRKDEIFKHDSGLLSIAGGKLTGYRKMSERILDQYIDLHMDHLEFNKDCHTADIKLIDCDFESEENFHEFQALCKHAHPWCDHDDILLLSHKYGRGVKDILERAERLMDSEHFLLQAEIDFSLLYEQVYSSSDFLIRRTGRLYFERPEVLKIFNFVHTYLAQFYQWDGVQIEKDSNDFKQAYDEVLTFKTES